MAKIGPNRAYLKGPYFGAKLVETAIFNGHIRRASAANFN